MTYKPTPTITTDVGEPRVWSIDTDSKESLNRIAETLERIQQQLELVTGIRLDSGNTL